MKKWLQIPVNIHAEEWIVIVEIPLIGEIPIRRVSSRLPVNHILGNYNFRPSLASWSRQRQRRGYRGRIR